MANQTGGDFCGGLPPAERALISGAPKHHDAAGGVIGGDTSHLSNARRALESDSPVSEIRPGWHPNLKNPKGK